MQNQEFEFTPSKSYLFLNSLVLLSSLGIVMGLSLLMVLKWFLFFLVALYGGYVIWRYSLLRSPLSILHIKRSKEGEWSLQTAENLFSGQLSDFSIVTSLVSVLRFNVPEQRFPMVCVIFRDSFLVPDDYRRLVMVLRMF